MQSTTKAVPHALASQPVATSTVQALTTRAAQLPGDTPMVFSEKQKNTSQQVAALGGVSARPVDYSVAATSGSFAVTAPSAAALAGGASTSTAALAATVTALHQSGQASTVFRLDPPGLGQLSVLVGIGTQGQVNVLFVPSTADAAQAIHASLPGLGGAMAQSGLTLGQAQVGGQFSQQGGQNDQGGYTPPRQGNAASPVERQTNVSGLSAYA